tara:strand:- start:506 stop:1369 length:864 start_codon:yes stop_codon:yes gene_type:complete
MVKKIKNFTGALALVVGALLLLSMYNLDFKREAKPTFDGTVSNYDLELVDAPSSGKVGDLYTVKVKVTNMQDKAGRMYVQCSILDADVSTFARKSGINYLNESDQCAPDEPFAQTGQISLIANAIGEYQFSMKVPKKGKDDVVFCAAYEVCSKENHPLDTKGNGIESDRIVQSLTISEPNKKTTTTETGETKKVTTDKLAAETTGTSCKSTKECSYILGNERCLNGYCVDKEDTPTKDGKKLDFPDFDDESIKGFASKNKIALIIVGLLLFIVGISVIFKTPAQRRF